MREHVSTSRMERFCASALKEEELIAIAEHVAYCQSCYQRFAETLRHQRGSAGIKFTLAPEFWVRREHLDYEQLAGMADNKLDDAEREGIDLHLQLCARCREDLRSFLAFREQTEPEMKIHYGPAAIEPSRKEAPWSWWSVLPLKPAYVAAVVLVVGILLVTAVFILKRRSANLEARQTPLPQINTGTSPPPSPNNQAARNLQPSPAPTQSALSPQPTSSPALAVKDRGPITKPEDSASVVALNEGQRTVTLNSAGNVSGLENIPAETQRDVREALLAQNIEQPEITKELSPTNITLRGPGAGQPFKLLSPARTVIISDRPSFEWEKLRDATAYKVIVGDMRGHEVAKSEDLSSDQTSWRPTTPLKRGETYAWNVIAIVANKEISSPGASASEMKFKVLSADSSQELEQLKKAGSHLALGVFYAREGMVSEAEGEFQMLVRDNPRLPILQKLLNEIQTWKR